MTAKLGPFADATKTSLLSLGNATRTAGPDLVASKPIVNKLGKLSNASLQPNTDLAFLLKSTRQADGYNNLARLFYYTANTLNGYDQYGHFQRTNLLVSGCVEYVSKSFGGCQTKWTFNDPTTASFKSALSDLSGGASPENLLDPVGPTGLTGPTGDTSVTGITGITGLTGATGVTDAGSLDGTDSSTDSADAAADEAVAPRRLSSQSGLESRMGVLDYLLGQ